MSEHMFGLGSGELTEEARKDFDRIAGENDAWFAGNPNLPGDGYRFWFACQNRGNPFDGATATAVMSALEDAGYREDGEWTDQCFGGDENPA